MSDEQPRDTAPEIAGQTLWQEVRSSAVLFALTVLVTVGVVALLRVTTGTLS